MSEIVEDYKQSLNELTFNSRPIIDTLTTIALENLELAEGILNAIVTRIYKCLPEQKLFALYLLDSICKNIGQPYNDLAGKEIFKLFSHVYLLVADNIRVKLQNLFETWKLTKAKGTNNPLFPREELDKIANFLQKARPAEKMLDDLSNGKLIRDIDELLPVFRQKLNTSNDIKLQDRFNALNQLKLLLQNQPMQVNELSAVQNQLNTIRQQEMKNSDSPVPTNSSIPPKPRTGTPSSLPPIPAVNNQVSSANELFDQLVNYGIITFDQELNGSRVYEINYPKNIDNNQHPSSNLLEQILSNQVARSEYEKAKYNELSKLKNAATDLQKFVSNSNISIQCKKLLYDTKGFKCSICGKRFNKDDVGQNRKRLHLDWHFRINKKLKSTNTVQSRNWYMDDLDWVKFNEDNLLEFLVDNGANGTNSGTNGASGPVEAEITGPMPYVVIPSDETNMNNKCLICREQVKGTFNEDLGEWCWANCIISPGESKTSRKIVHATCFNETRKRNAQDDINPQAKRERV